MSSVMNFTITDVSEVITCPQCYFFSSYCQMGNRECKAPNFVKFEGKSKYVGGKIRSVPEWLQWKQADRRENQTILLNGID